MPDPSIAAAPDPRAPGADSKPAELAWQQGLYEAAIQWLDALQAEQARLWDRYRGLRVEIGLVSGDPPHARGIVEGVLRRQAGNVCALQVGARTVEFYPDSEIEYVGPDLRFHCENRQLREVDALDNVHARVSAARREVEERRRMLDRLRSRESAGATPPDRVAATPSEEEPATPGGRFLVETMNPFRILRTFLPVTLSEQGQDIEIDRTTYDPPSGRIHTHRTTLRDGRRRDLRRGARRGDPRRRLSLPDRPRPEAGLRGRPPAPRIRRARSALPLATSWVASLRSFRNLRGPPRRGADSEPCRPIERFRLACIQLPTGGPVDTDPSPPSRVRRAWRFLSRHRRAAVLLVLLLLLGVAAVFLSDPDRRRSLRLRATKLVYGPPPYEDGRPVLEEFREMIWTIDAFRREDWEADGQNDWPASLAEIGASFRARFPSVVERYRMRGSEWDSGMGDGCYAGTCQGSDGACFPCDAGIGVYDPQVLAGIPPLSPEAREVLAAAGWAQPCPWCRDCPLSVPNAVPQIGGGYVAGLLGRQYHYVPRSGGWQAWTVTRPSGNPPPRPYGVPTFYADETCVIRYELEDRAGQGSEPVWNVDQAQLGP